MSNQPISVQVIEKENKLYAILLYFISPLLAVFVALKNYNKNWSKNIVWLFVIFYGYTFVISSEGIDASRYRDALVLMAQQDMSSLGIYEILFERGQDLDILQPLITFVVSRFTSNYHILFAVFGAIFGFFYSRNIWYLIEKRGGKIKFGHVIILITFSFIVGFWQINGFRFWTATHIFFYGAIPYITKRNKSKLIFILFAVFTHFSFAIPAVIFIIYLLFGNKPKLYFYLFLATFFISEINLDVVRESLLNYLPSMFHDKVEDYTGEAYVKVVAEKSTQLNWYISYYGKGLSWMTFLILGMLYYRKEKLRSIPLIFNIMNFSLLFLAISNLLSLVPSGARFSTVAMLFAVATVYFFIQLFPLNYNLYKLTPFLYIGYLFFDFITLRVASDTIGLVTVLGNPIVMLFGEGDIPLIDLIK